LSNRLAGSVDLQVTQTYLQTVYQRKADFGLENAVYCVLVLDDCLIEKMSFLNDNQGN
jgi:hypothetical protein